MSVVMRVGDCSSKLKTIGDASEARAEPTVTIMATATTPNQRYEPLM
jgi:hypothetical protein